MHVVAHSTATIDGADVEDAYRRFVRTARFGPVLTAAILAATAVLIAVARLAPSAATFVSVVSYALVASSVVVAALRADRQALGVVWRGTFTNGARAFLYGSCVGAAMGLLTFATSVLAARVYTSSPEAVIDPATVLLIIVAGPTLSPVAEEFVFQGWLQTRLGRWGPWTAAIWTTMAFLLVHAPASGWDLVRLPALCVFAALRASHRALASCVGAHVAYNVTLLAAAGVGSVMGMR